MAMDADERQGPTCDLRDGSELSKTEIRYMVNLHGQFRPGLIKNLLAGRLGVLVTAHQEAKKGDTFNIGFAEAFLRVGASLVHVPDILATLYSSWTHAGDLAIECCGINGETLLKVLVAAWASPWLRRGRHQVLPETEKPGIPLDGIGTGS